MTCPMRHRPPMPASSESPPEPPCAGLLLEQVVGHVVASRLGERVVVARLEVVGELVVADRQRAVLVGRPVLGLARFLAHGQFLRREPGSRVTPRRV